ncbi:armadillo-type protein [Pseudomassariella vexata]|uniref:Armadillo-type protein n=1 Tax=Pseudomassariella vexata TaxID=1141098 RepID=A0A1Y2EDK4_9PEZI|nr:armadillo-type protein [Pseudomassariella vexata]ORY69497.1 armadillo-type protein [Pseudomassariella vexata]
MDEIPMPTSLQEVERLVKTLYEPNSAQTIFQVQEVLQRLQKSPEGWQLAEGLLSRPDDNLKFFGALTIIVKLNTDEIDNDGARSILQNIIAFLLESLDNGSGAIVIRKLCSALVTHFIHFSHLWPSCVRNLLYCLQLNESVAIQDVIQSGKNVPPVAGMIAALNLQMTVAATWFATSLAEEVAKTDAKSTKYINLHERLLENSQDVAALLAYSISNLAGSPAQKESIGCFQAWVMYGQRVPTAQLITSLRPLIQPAIKCIAFSALYETTVELLTDALNNWTNIFAHEDYKALYSLFESDWSRERYQRLLQGDFDFDSVQFGLFMVAFGSAQISDLMETPNSAFLEALVGLLSAQGYAVAEDKIFVPALEFWSEFVETVGDEVDSGSADWKMQTLSTIMQVVSHCWRKIQYPPISDFSSWDSTERIGFGDARKDVADLLQSVYTFSGKQLLSLFADLTLQGLSSMAWAELEAAAFCLGSLSDCIPDDGACDDDLTTVFGSPLFELLREGRSTVPVRARQTCLSLIERYTDYFERRAEFLPAALNLLFTAVNEQHLAGPSAKSIYKLCSSCRGLLTSEVDAFLDQYASLRTNPNLDSLIEEKIAGAVASIIQAIPEESRRFDAFRRLLLLIATDVEQCLQLKAYDGTVDPNDPVVLRAYDTSQRPEVPVASSEVSSQIAVRALRCLLGTSRGLQAPSESLIDLEAEAKAALPVNPDLEQIQKSIIGILDRLKNTFAESSETLGVICSILRAGFSETEPGPFVFPPQMVTDFLTSPWQNRVASAVYTANVFVSSLHNGSNKNQEAEAISQFLPWAISLIQQLADPADDPELAQYVIELAQQAMTKRPDIFMQLQPTSSLEYLFMFSIRLLNGSEPLPKFAAADFWTSFITLRAPDECTNTAINSASTHLGPILSKSLIHNVGGNASRSELDKLSDPLKKMVVQHVNARHWLEAALGDAAFPSTKVSSDDKALFLKKILNLRGSRATNQVIREFWLSCRGSDFAYAS